MALLDGPLTTALESRIGEKNSPTKATRRRGSLTSSSSTRTTTTFTTKKKSKRELLKESSKMVLTLWQRYRQATSTKMYDVEELVDYYFHRRLAAFTAVTISYLPFVITPNQITLFGLVLGWASATCLYDSEFHTVLGWDPKESLFAAAFFMFAWIVSDCADGQVARLCRRGTRTGRILDGVVDGLVLAPNCLVIAMISSNRYGQPYFPFTIFSGLSLWIHAIVYDKVKNVYMENALPQSECDGETVESVTEEYLEAKEKNPYSLDHILLGIYVIYLTLQRKFTHHHDPPAPFSVDDKSAQRNRQEYVKKYYYVVRLASFMGISAHVVGLYLAYFAAIFYQHALFVVQIYFSVVLNLILLTVLFLFKTTGMATSSQKNM